MTYKYNYPNTNADPTLVAQEINAAISNYLIGIYYLPTDDSFHVEVVDDDHKFIVDGAIANNLNSYVEPINGPLKELENVEIEHTYTAETETVIHTKILELGKPSWIYVTLNGTSVVGANDEMQHRIALTTGETITNDIVITEGLASGVSNVWSRVWWIYVNSETTTLELFANFVPDVNSVEPYEQDTTLTLLVHEAL